MLAVHFGAGNIGRGFIGSLLYQSGFETCFVDVNSELVDLINEKKQYRVVLAEGSQQETTIQNVQAINSQQNPDKIIAAIVQAEVITTAVGPHILPFISRLLAEGLRKRYQETDKSLNIIACENMIGGSTLLKEKVYEHLTEEEKELFHTRFGFPDSAVDRIVPNQVNEDKLMVVVEPFYEWVVDESQIIGEKPAIKGITFVQDLIPYIERKLFTVNTGHALAAYIGYYFGMKTIDEAMENEEVCSLVKGALQESGAFLTKKYGFDAEEHAQYIQKIVKRFSNAYISDEITRVARSPIRKLGPNDRLVSPAQQYVDIIGDEPSYLVKGIAAALLYDYAEDEEAVKVQQMLQDVGLAAAIERLTELDQDSMLFQLIMEQYQLLKENKQFV